MITVDIKNQTWQTFENGEYLQLECSIAVPVFCKVQEFH
jgi:hypothetical protein